jgi:hypothetical protein
VGSVAGGRAAGWWDPRVHTLVQGVACGRSNTVRYDTGGRPTAGMWLGQCDYPSRAGAESSRPLQTHLPECRLLVAALA